MLRRRTSRLRAILGATAIATLATFAVALAQDFAVHTDDGCRVERHCVACRGTAARMATANVSVAYSPVFTPCGSLAGLAPAPAPDPVSVDVPSRGPPARS
jgi:hypothetical protein